jgi:hypothetical protein
MCGQITEAEYNFKADELLTLRVYPPQFPKIFEFPLGLRINY